VIRAVDFIVVSRPGYTCPTPDGARVQALETLALVISSSEIRRRLEAGGEVPELHPEVFGYIRQHGLYR
jgi:nicotinic acid mononucleotide adenylyltransferase